MGATHFSGLSISPTAVTAATLAVTESDHAGKVTSLNLAAGQAVTLPPATGSGNKFSFFVGITVTGSTTISAANANDTMAGSLILDGDSSTMFQTAATSDRVTMNGSTQGGLLGSQIVIEDVAANVWMVNGVVNGSGVIITPFSASV